MAFCGSTSVYVILGLVAFAVGSFVSGLIGYELGVWWERRRRNRRPPRRGGGIDPSSEAHTL